MEIGIFAWIKMSPVEFKFDYRKFYKVMCAMYNRWHTGTS